jgi:hypothetical protein
MALSAPADVHRPLPVAIHEACQNTSFASSNCRASGTWMRKSPGLSRIW